MNSGDRDDQLQKATEKASTEVTRAAIDVSRGCEISEAIDSHVGNGVEDTAGEFAEIGRRLGGDGKKLKEVASRLDKGSPQLRYRVSSCGRYLLPYTQLLIPEIGARIGGGAGPGGEEILRQRQQLDGMRRAPKALSELFVPAAEIQTSLKYPPAFVPEVAHLIYRPDVLHAAAHTVIVVGVIAWMARKPLKAFSARVLGGVLSQIRTK